MRCLTVKKLKTASKMFYCHWNYESGYFLSFNGTLNRIQFTMSVFANKNKVYALNIFYNFLVYYVQFLNIIILHK